MKKSLAAVAMLAVLACGCSDSQSDITPVLTQAEAVMADHPDSALMLLQSIDTTRLQPGSRDHALFDLLLTQAHHKNDVPLRGDSAIGIAVEYFKAKNDDKHLMLACYYKGLRSLEVEKLGEAMVDMMKTHELAETLDEHYWNAQAFNKLGLIYAASNNWPMAPYAQEQAAKYFKLAEHTLYWQWTLRDLAEAYVFSKQPEKADSLLDVLLTMSNEPGADPYLKPNILSLARTANVWKRDYKRAHQFQAALDSCGGFSPYHDIRDVTMRAILALEANEHRKGLQIVKEGYERYAQSRTDSLQLYDAEGRIYRALGMNEAKSEAIGKIIEIQNSLIKQWSEQSVTGAQRDYMMEKALEAQKAASRTRLVALAVVLAVIFLATAAVIILVARNRRQRNERLAEFLNLTRNLDEEQDKIRELTSRNEALAKQAEALPVPPVFRNLFNHALAYFTAGTEKGRKRSMDEFNNAIREIYGDESMRFLADSVNRTHNGLIDRLRQQVPNLSGDLFNLYVLSSLGLSKRTISEITGIKLHYLYNRLTHCRETIEASDAPDKDEFLQPLTPR